ncbi:efflux pump antibiotic resistance protein, putative [Talaromyces stipitatus ATCC 10500]|uniref:Efflux pump antibiotic resistance protein, putative n=1 Tax=Talaromyces stipitatus (strain ATCC 10500 / CBS 375.48 / QM 6759 / NRRL 1006) TaxID=441959 RepID=B8M992_TALSN|nr:efflux pump antibiotic resistance protein, putative [Talaromyces stipitatus ATCC 10500]EED17387.1 efflux pump antibiotic resistance protein, putative [Talaromyces stipitatus ATCC 10500]
MSSDQDQVAPVKEQASIPPESAEQAVVTYQSPGKKGFKFWAVIATLSIAGNLTALEATIVSTALPTIITELNGADKYIWVANAYLLSFTALQPIYGQLANVFGRRHPMLISTAFYILGSGICGGANNIEMLIAGRAIQGIGAAGLNVLIEIVVCDITPLRERGLYLGIVMGSILFSSGLGPLFGGLIVQNTSWRWVFYLNLPIGGVVLVAMALFLQVKFDNKMAFTLKRLDLGGSIIFAGSAASISLALAWAGSAYSWSSVQVILPLVMGFVGLGCFLMYESFLADPIMPLRLFQNRTSLIAFFLTFLHAIGVMMPLYFLPVYFQAVLGASPERSGIDLLPTILTIIPFAMTAGVLLQQLGRYKPIHFVGSAALAISFGLFSLLDENSSTAAWVLFQMLMSAGAGLIIPTLLPAVQAELTDADTGSATGTWTFIRSFGMTWGVTIPSTIFNDRTSQLSARIQDPSVVSLLTGGQAYERATKEFVNSIADPTVRAQVISVFAESLKRMWQVGIAFVALGFLVVLLEKEVPLRKELNTEYGIEK